MQHFIDIFDDIALIVFIYFFFDFDDFFYVDADCFSHWLFISATNFRLKFLFDFYFLVVDIDMAISLLDFGLLYRSDVAFE